MTKVKRITSLFVAVVMLVAISCTSVVFAAKDTDHTITITNDKAGHEYTAYQIFVGDLDTSNTKLSNITWGNGVDSADLLNALDNDATLGEKFTSTMTAEEVADKVAGFDASQLDAFAQIVGNHLNTAAGKSDETKSPYEITVTGDGYYLIKDTKEIAADDAATKYIIQVVKDVTVEAKADAPTLDKVIVEDNTDVDANNGSVGDTVNYKLTSKVPDMDGYNKYFFIVHDELSEGLTFDKDSVVVKIGENTLTKDTDYEVVTTGLDDNCTFEIVFKNFINRKEEAGTAITITYSATIDEDAVIGNEGNPNNAHLVYSNNPNVDSDGENDRPDRNDPTGETPKDYTITYVTGIELIKEDTAGNRLTGAEFQIKGNKVNKVKTAKETFEENSNGTYYKLKDGTYTTTAPSEETTDKYENTKIKYTRTVKVDWETKTEEVDVTGVVNENGVLVFDGLAEGDYVITEIKAPEGYNILTDSIKVTITCGEPSTVTDGTEDAEWKYSVSGALTKGETTMEDGRVHLTVENKSGATLPSTGGIGTTIFYIIGGVLVAGAAVAIVIIVKRVKR